MDFLLAILPILVLIAMLAGLKLPAWKAALIALATGVAEAWAWQGVGVKTMAAEMLKGVQTGLFPIGLVIVAALFTYAITVESGAIEDIKAGLSALSGDKRFFALLTVWGFGNFMEGIVRIVM